MPIGDLSSTLGAATLSSDGDVFVVGTASVTLGNVTSSSAGAVNVVGVLSKTLDSLSQVSAGGPIVSGTLDKLLDNLVVSSMVLVRLLEPTAAPMTQQKFYRTVLSMREAQREYDRDPSKANRTAMIAAERAVDKECANQIAEQKKSDFGAKVRDLREAQDRYWRTFDAETKALARALAVVVDRDLEKLLV